MVEATTAERTFLISLSTECASPPMRPKCRASRASATAMSIDSLFNVWLCVRKHVIHDTPEAGRLTALSHSV